MISSSIVVFVYVVCPVFLVLGAYLLIKKFGVSNCVEDEYDVE